MSSDPKSPSILPPDPRRNFLSYFKRFSFPCGERHVQFERDRYDQDWKIYSKAAIMHGDGESSVKTAWPTQIRIPFYSGHSDSIIENLLLADACKKLGVKRVDAALLYTPYGRQDRVANVGEALGLKVFMDMIKYAFHTVLVLDPHSDVTPALIRNPSVLSQEHAMLLLAAHVTSTNAGKASPLLPNPFTDSSVVLVAPDVGAAKKIHNVANALGLSNIAQGHKDRDTKTGKLSGFRIDTTTVERPGGRDYLIVDDLIDGGGTFVGLADEIRKITNGKIYLACSYGMFTKGVIPFVGKLDHIFVAEAPPTLFSTHELSLFPNLTIAKVLSK